MQKNAENEQQQANSAEKVQEAEKEEVVEATEEEEKEIVEEEQVTCARQPATEAINHPVALDIDAHPEETTSLEVNEASVPKFRS